MPATPEQLLDLLEAPYWKTAGSTYRKDETEGRVATRTEGTVPMNVAVVDHIRKGRQVLAEAERIRAEGTPFAVRKAEALRRAQALKSMALMGERTDVRKVACPSCGAYGLMLSKAGRAVCINRHCAPAGVQRNWGLVEVLMAAPGRPTGVRRSVNRPRDARNVATLTRYLAHTAHPVTADRLRKIVKIYELPSWPAPTETHPTALAYSLSDVLTAHAVDAAKRNPSDCAQSPKPACDGLADAFFSAGMMGRIKVAEAKALCDGCPFREPCLDAALADPDELQHGVRGGLTARERCQMKTAQKIPTTNLRNGPRDSCTRGHLRTAANTGANGNCRTCDQAKRAKQREEAEAAAD